MRLKRPWSYLFLLLPALFLPQLGMAHANQEVLNQLSRTDVVWIYTRLGFSHIIPLGLDHILFVLCLFLLNPNLKTVLWQSLAFTLSHSITLGLAMYGMINPPAHIVEPVIALSIMFLAIENVISDKLKASRILVVFCFGLIHGMGFASALTELGLPDDKFVTALVTFNVGVELGQITIILGAWLFIGKWFGTRPWYRKRIVWPVSSLIAVIALYWVFQRAFFP